MGMTAHGHVQIVFSVGKVFAARLSWYAKDKLCVRCAVAFEFRHALVLCMLQHRLFNMACLCPASVRQKQA